MWFVYFVLFWSEPNLKRRSLSENCGKFVHFCAIITVKPRGLQLQRIAANHEFIRFLPQSVVKYEEDESKKRPAEKDSVLFLDTCAKLKKLFAEIAKLKTETTEKAQQ